MGEIRAINTDQCDGWLLRERLSCHRFALLSGKAGMWIYSLPGAVTKYNGEIHPRDSRRWPVGSGKGLQWQKGAWGWWTQRWAGSDPETVRQKHCLFSPTGSPCWQAGVGGFCTDLSAWLRQLLTWGASCCCWTGAH